MYVQIAVFLCYLYGERKQSFTKIRGIGTKYLKKAKEKS